MLTRSTIGCSSGSAAGTAATGFAAGALGSVMGAIGGYALHYSAPINRAMSLTPEEIAELQAKAAKADDLEQRLVTVDSKKGEILDEKKKLQQENEQLRQKEEDRRKKEMEEQGRLQELLDEARATIAELQKQLKDKDEAITQTEKQRIGDRLRSDFMSAVASQVFDPEDAWTVFNSKVVDRDGKTFVLYKGEEIAPKDLPERLRSDKSKAYMCLPVGKSGMGTKPTTGEPIDISGNPYLPGGSVTKRLSLELDNPDLAARLKAEAATAASKG